MQISPASIDRPLVGRRPRVTKSRGLTKPGTSLKHQIPIRAWADWIGDKPRFCEVDLVDYSGGSTVPGTDHARTLCFTDVRPAGWSAFPHETRLKSTCSMQSAVLAGVCPSAC